MSCVAFPPPPLTILLNDSLPRTPITTPSCPARNTKERLPDGRKNWYPCQEATIPFFCLGHSAERAEHERSKEVDRLSDLTQGKEDREPYEDSKPYKVPADIGLAFRKFSSVLASPGTANGRGHGHGHGGGGGVTGTFDVASVAQQWGQLFPEFPLPRGLLTTPKSTDFTYVADTVDRWGDETVSKN